MSAGLLVLGGVAVYLDARSRDRLLGYTFMRRMGLGRAQHRRGPVVELTASVLRELGGLGIAVGGVARPREHRPVPGTHRPLLRPALPSSPAWPSCRTLIVLAVVLAQRRMERDDPVEVLRAGA